MIGEKLKELRKSKGITAEALCTELGISSGSYRNYERNDRNPPYDVLLKIADYYGVSLDYLFGREPAPNPFADMGLSETSEQDMLSQYMSFPPEVRAVLMDALIKLADSAKPEEQSHIVEETTVGAELDRRAASDAEAEETAG